MPARYNLWALLALSLWAPASSWGQMPDAAAIEAARLKMQEAMARIAKPGAAQDVPAMPGARELSRQPVSAMPRLAVPRANLDLADIVARSRALPQYGQAPRDPADDLLVFVSLSMPPETLRLLAEQAGRAGAVLVLRGLKQDSMRLTLAEVQKILGGQSAPWQINPEAFRRFAVEQAPTFVLARPVAACQGRCPEQAAAPAESYVKAVGDVSLDYALEAVARGAAGWRDLAEARLQRMRRQP